MKITDVRIRKILSDSKMKCIASLTFDDAFVVHDIKVVEGQNGLFVAMPSRKIGDSGFRDVAHPIKTEVRKVIQDAVISAYVEALKEQGLSTEGIEVESSESDGE